MLQVSLYKSVSCQIKWVILLNIRLRHDKYELVRYGLKKYNLIEDGPSLEDRQCEVDWDKGQCYNCMATHICAKKVFKGRPNPRATAVAVAVVSFFSGSIHRRCP